MLFQAKNVNYLIHNQTTIVFNTFIKEAIFLKKNSLPYAKILASILFNIFFNMIYDLSKYVGYASVIMVQIQISFVHKPLF